MIDDDDVTFWLFMADGRGWLGLVSLVVLVVVMFMACSNEKECEARRCEKGGTARLLDGECVCTERPAP